MKRKYYKVVSGETKAEIANTTLQIRIALAVLTIMLLNTIFQLI